MPVRVTFVTAGTKSVIVTNYMSMVNEAFGAAWKLGESIIGRLNSAKKSMWRVAHAAQSYAQLPAQVGRSQIEVGCGLEIRGH
jgi:hypothetical protein